MFKAESIVYLWMYMTISCNCENDAANHLNSGQQLLALTLRENP